LTFGGWTGLEPRAGRRRERYGVGLRVLIFLGFRMATGTVKWFNEAKGYGFITPDDGGQDLFAHFSEIQAQGFKTLQEKQKVSFEVKTGPKGKQAAQIRPV
jgi:cold shock CspA family protein